MKLFQLAFFSLIMLLSNNIYAADSLPRYFKLMPQPQQVKLLPGGKGISYNALSAFYLKGNAERPVLYESLRSLPLSAKPAKGVITLNISSASNIPESSEGYLLEIKNDQVAITARAQAGLFYGCQTLSQLLEDARDQRVKIPECTITDYPDIAYRAIHLDLKHHLDAIGYYDKMIDRLAGIKINSIIVEFEDKLRYRKVPIVGASHAISVEQFAALSRYARERNIEISPLVQGLGHASFILKHEEYKKLREDSTSDWAFSPLDSGTYDLQFSLYEDAIAATPGGKYLHVGGDEVGNLGMSALSKASGMKPFELQMYWLNKVSAFAKQHNRIPIFWDDMVFKLANLYKTTYDSKMPASEVEKAWLQNKAELDKNIHLFPQNCVYMRWNYDDPAILGNFKAIDWYNSHNLSVMAATAAQTMWPIMPREHSNFQPIKDFCKITVDKKLDGILCTAWDDCSPHFETFWRGFYSFALFSWNYKDISLNEAERMYRHRFYGAGVSDSSFEFQDLLEQSLPFWETALINKGHRNNAARNIDLMDLPDKKLIGSWSNKYKEKIIGAKKAVAQYDIIRARIKKSINNSNRNRYSLSLMNEINELQIYPARLLLLLEKFDRSSLADRQAQMNQIRDYVSNFAVIRKQFEKVFSETRILSNPDDYQLDSNHHHHFANATVNSDWMYIFELAMNDAILKWMTP